MKNENLKNPEVLAFERKLCPSDGVMYFGSWKDRKECSKWNAIMLQHKDVRGTISNRLKSTVAIDTMKLNAEVQKPNLQSVDVASIPHNADTLKLSFSMRILGNIWQASSCNNQEYQAELFSKLSEYDSSEQFRELSYRYAENIANGRFLWRNRIGAERVEVVVSICEDGQIAREETFDAKKFSLTQFSGQNDSQLDSLAQSIQRGLRGKANVFLKIDAFAYLGEGQEVFPSQELTLDSGNGKNKKSKVLYAINGIAAMHSQKIGNAIRTIDTWYPNAEEFGPIAVEPYGSVTSRGAAFRKPKAKADFYSIFDKWILNGVIPSVTDQHYAVACLIRGGVYGEKSE